jgi:(2Fe-2S) ferredoxin
MALAPQSPGSNMSDDKPYYEHHVFFCTNEREGKDARPSCGKSCAFDAMKHAKERVKKLGLSGQGKVRINKAGCLDRCEEGPVVVIYPQGTWYTYIDNSDIDDIIDQHIVKGEVVERLKI